MFYLLQIGSAKMAKTGVTIITTVTTPRIFNPKIFDKPITIGNPASTSFWSFENLFKILPVGVWSIKKNY